MVKYIQSTDFTCGSACLITALAHFFPQRQFTRLDEFTIWREGNTVFMGGSNAGISAYGLALSAQARGLETVIYDSGHAELLVTRQHAHPKFENDVFLEMLTLDQQRYTHTGAPLHLTEVTQDEWFKHLAAGYVALALVQERDGPDLHWVLIYGINPDGTVNMHDSYPYKGKVAEEAKKPMSFTEFWKWTEMPPLSRRTVIFARPKVVLTSNDAWAQLWSWWLWPFSAAR